MLFREVVHGHQILVLSMPEHISITIGRPVPVANVSADIVEDHWWIARALVRRPEDRGKGLGSIALARLLQEVRRSTVQLVWVAPGGYGSNPSQVTRFYKKHGFVQRRDGLMIWEP